MTECSLADAVDAFAAAAQALVTADVQRASTAELLDAYATIETATRQVPTLGHAILNRLDRESAPLDHGATSWWKVLTRRCRISKGDAQKRMAWARLLGPRRAINGEPLPPHYEYTATAQAQGLIGPDHIQHIKDFFTHLPTAVDAETRLECEHTLAGLATQLEPADLGKATARLLAHLHPDGTLTDTERQNLRGLVFGKQRPDGMSRLSGWVTPQFRALFEPLLAKFDDVDPTDLDAPMPDLTDTPDAAPTPDGPAAPEQDGLFDPEQPDPDSSDEPTPRSEPACDQYWRTSSQRTHDAFLVIARMLLRSTTIGTLNGLPVSVVVTTTLQELLKGAGFAVTAGGSHLPISDLIKMAAHAYHYLGVFDQHTGQALYLGRTQRCASGPQKLMLFARDRGCTCPGCDAAGYATQAHHAVTDWDEGGLTNVDDMTLACPPDNNMVENTGWTTRRRKDGRFEWIPPPELDTGQPRINHTHHPERLLNPEEDPPF